MTTNLVKYMNFVLKGAQALPINALINEIFNKINYSFVTNDMVASMHFIISMVENELIRINRWVLYLS